MKNEPNSVAGLVRRAWGLPLQSSKGTINRRRKLTPVPFRTPGPGSSGNPHRKRASAAGRSPSGTWWGKPGATTRANRAMTEHHQQQDGRSRTTYGVPGTPAHDPSWPRGPEAWSITCLLPTESHPSSHPTPTPCTAIVRLLDHPQESPVQARQGYESVDRPYPFRSLHRDRRHATRSPLNPHPRRRRLPQHDCGVSQPGSSSGMKNEPNSVAGLVRWACGDSTFKSQRGRESIRLRKLTPVPFRTPRPR